MEGWIAKGGLQAVSRDRLRALSRKSDLAGALQTASHLGAIAATTAGLVVFVPPVPWTFVPLFVAQGILINCLYAGQHELSHWTAYRTKALNDLVGHLFGFVTLNPFLTDRWIHFAHHRATHDAHRDPEIMGTGPYTLSSYILDLTGVSFWYRRVTGIVRAAAGRGLETCYWLDPRQRRIVILESRLHVALWMGVAVTSLMLRTWLAVEFWFAPMLLTKFFHQLQNMGEHTGLPHDPDIFVNTRTLKGPAPIRWLVWNMSWHTAHHCFPGVPFHALPALDAEIRAGLGRPIPTKGYIEAQRDIFSVLMAKA